MISMSLSMQLKTNNRLRVRRQIYSGRLTQPVVVDSVYNRTPDIAQWNIYNDLRPVVFNKSATDAFKVRDMNAWGRFLTMH